MILVVSGLTKVVLHGGGVVKVDGSVGLEGASDGLEGGYGHWMDWRGLWIGGGCGLEGEGGDGLEVGIR